MNVFSAWNVDKHKTTFNFGGCIPNIPEVYDLSNTGHIGVTWDKINANGSLREKLPYSDGNKGVVTVDKPRVLKDELIAEGCRVKRGTPVQTCSFICNENTKK